MRYLSLFSGMEAAHLAWAPLGWGCAGVAEVEPAACQLLRHRLPGVLNLGNVTKVTAEVIAKLGHLDVVIGGSPCQDLSVAGKRAGLSGERSSLFHEQLRIFNAARTLCGARWLVWENVPGAFSSNKGRDFAVVVGEMAGCRLAVPAEGWGNEGVALGDNGLVEWSVLDSQWFGVAQRRRRVFAVLDTGDWANRPPVLLEPDRLRGDSAPRRETWQSVAGTLAGGARRSGGYSADDVGLVPSVARCDTTGEGARLDAVAIGCDTYNGSLTGEVAATLSTQSGDGVSAGPSVMQGMAVRRLTPVECERLQAAPDNWTLVPKLGRPRTQRKNEPDAHYAAYLERHSGGVDLGPMMADGPRYKMLGNSFTATVIRWIGHQIEAAHGNADQQREAA